MRVPRLITGLAAFWVSLEFIACLWASVDISARLIPLVDFSWSIALITGIPLGVVAIAMIRRTERRLWLRPRHIVPPTQSCALVATFAPAVLMFADFTGELHDCTAASWQLGFLGQPSFLMLLIAYIGALFTFWLLDRTRNKSIQKMLTAIHGPESVEMRVTDAASAFMVSNAAAELSHDD
jgi:hypothetical protein